MKAQAQVDAATIRPWTKAGFLQSFIEENINLTPRAGAALLYSHIMSGAVDADDATETLEYAWRHALPVIKTKLETPAQKRARKKALEKRRTETNKQTQMAIQQGRERFAALIMNMTGAQVRELQNLPKNTFAHVRDDQRIGDVMTADQVLKIITPKR